MKPEIFLLSRHLSQSVVICLLEGKRLHSPVSTKLQIPDLIRTAYRSLILLFPLDWTS